MHDGHPKWLFNEAIHAGVDYSNRELAADYDSQHQGFRNYREEAEKIIRFLELSKESVVLDIGCGTGGLSTHLAKSCRQVYAVDISEEMISILEDKIKKQKIRNISTVQAGFLSYEHKGEAPDAVITNAALHHLPDFWKQITLCRLHDILKPGGSMFLADVVFNFPPGNYQKRINEWLEDTREIAGPKLAEEAVIHIREEFSTWDWVMRGMLERAGFNVADSVESDPMMHSYICFKKKTMIF